MTTISCNIPFGVVQHPNFVAFMAKYTNRVVPSRFTLTRSMESKSPVILSKIKEEVEGKDIFMALDETTDPLQRSMTAVLIGPLDGHFLGRPYLINLEDVKKADNETMTNVAVSSIRNVFGSEFQRERLKIFITDGAAYCIKAAENLRDHYPRMIHVTCLAHGLNRGTWIKAVDYYASHFEIVRDFVNGLEDTKHSIERAKTVINEESLHNEIKFINQHMDKLRIAIACLEERLPLLTSATIVENLLCEITIEPFKSKSKEIIEKNTGYIELRELAEQAQDEGSVHFIFRNAPIVNCDAERVFSMMKTVNTPKRTKLTPQHIKQIMLIRWNSEFGGKA
ncbi:Putative LOC100902024, partial [Caligus rogercresseyi]